MGNYSYFDDQQGCKIDLKSLEAIKTTLIPEVLAYFSFTDDKLEADNLGEFMDGWKIQGYWYPGFVKFLYACADCMPELTEDKYDNQIAMTEEQGFKFYIYFFKEDGKAKVSISYCPMEFIDEDMERED